MVPCPPKSVERFAVLLGLVADGQLSAIGREAVVLVAAGGKSGVDQLGFAADGGQFADAAGAVEKEVLPVVRPVGRFDQPERVIDHTPIFRGDDDGFQGAFQERSSPGSRLAGAEFDVGKDRLLKRVVVVGANAQPDIERVLELDLERATCRTKRRACRGKGHENAVALLLNPDPCRCGNVRLDFTGRAAPGFAILKRSETIPVNHGISVGRTGVQILPNQEARFAMGIAAGADPADIRSECHIARHLFPHEMKCIICGPHVFAAASNEVALCGRIVSNRASPVNGADITVACELSEC